MDKRVQLNIFKYLIQRNVLTIAQKQRYRYASADDVFVKRLSYWSKVSKNDYREFSEFYKNVIRKIRAVPLRDRKIKNVTNEMMEMYERVKTEKIDTKTNDKFYGFYRHFQTIINHEILNKILNSTKCPTNANLMMILFEVLSKLIATMVVDYSFVEFNVDENFLADKPMMEDDIKLYRTNPLTNLIVEFVFLTDKRINETMRPFMDANTSTADIFRDETVLSGRYVTDFKVRSNLLAPSNESDTERSVLFMFVTMFFACLIFTIILLAIGFHGFTSFILGSLF